MRLARAITCRRAAGAARLVRPLARAHLQGEHETGRTLDSVTDAVHAVHEAAALLGVRVGIVAVLARAVPGRFRLL